MLNILNSYYVNFLLFIFVVLINQFLVLTSKEFKRKCAYYRPLASAVSLFTNPAFDGSVYRVNCMDSLGRKLELFTAEPTLLLYGDTNLTGFKYLYFDLFTLNEFRIELKYFQSFVSLLSKYQLDVINADPQFNYLLNFISK